MEYFFASDASALVEHTKSVLVLEDDDVAHVAHGRYNVYRADREAQGKPAEEQQSVSRVILTLQMEVSQIMKGEFSHFMQKEIHEQPESIIGTLRGRIQYDGGNGEHDILSLISDAKCGDLDSTAARMGSIKLGGLCAPNNHIICRSRRILFVACGTSFNAALAARQVTEPASIYFQPPRGPPHAQRGLSLQQPALSHVRAVAR